LRVTPLKSNDRDVPPRDGAPPKPRNARQLALIALVALGASLPILAGALSQGVVAADGAPAAAAPQVVDFSKLEDGEDKPGGGATSRGSVDNANAFSHSSGNLDFKRELDFKVGNAMFRKNWVSAPA
jgi:hypothetical protein